MAHSSDTAFSGFEPLGKATRFAEDIHEVIGQAPLFGDLSSREVAALCEFMDCYAAPRHGVLIREGEAGDFLVILLTGKAVVVKEGSDGIRRAIASVGPGEALGEMSIIDGGVRFATCIATEPVDFAVLDRKALNEILASLPRLGNKILLLLLQLMAQRLRDTGLRLLPHLESSIV